MVDIKQERAIEIDLSREDFRDRLFRWAVAHAFTCESESVQKWVFERGTSWHALYMFDIGKIPTKVVVERSAENPSRSCCSVHCGSWLSVSSGPADDKAISEQLDILIATLTGAL